MASPSEVPGAGRVVSGRSSEGHVAAGGTLRPVAKRLVPVPVSGPVEVALAAGDALADAVLAAVAAAGSWSEAVAGFPQVLRVDDGGCP